MSLARGDLRIAVPVLALLALVALIGAGRADAALPQQSGLVDLKTDAAVVMTGTSASGSSVAALGDFNGDGFGDTATGRQFSTAAQVEFGSASTASLDMDALGARGFQITLSETNSRLFVAKAGDVNGDGTPDLLVAANGTSPLGRSGAGSVFVVFGGPSTSPVDLSNLGSRGFRIDGAAANQFIGSNSVAGAEDVNGDGKADIVVGSPSSPDAYVIFGKSGTGAVDLAALGSGGFVVSPPGGQTIGNAGTGEGRPYMLTGDMNGDGKAEVIFGVPTENAGRGGAYVVFGKSSSTPVSLAALGAGGFHISTATPQAGLAGIGQTVGGSCDVNGDGLADAVVGTNTGGSPPTNGEAIVVFGRSATSDVDLGALGSGGFLIKGAPADYASEWLGSTADLNGDGLCDLVIGAYQAQPAGRSQQDGKGYVVYGKATTGTVDLSSLSASEGYTIIGADSPMFDSAGREIDAGTDFNGDGRPDLIIGASGANGFSGAAYIIYGFGPAPPPPPIQNPNDQLTVEKAEQFIGLGPGETKSVTVSCPSGYLVLDGSPLIQQIDHGLPSFVQILQSESTSSSSYTFTLRNPTSGNAQAKGFVTCVKSTTTDGGVISVSGQITASAPVTAGPSSRTLTCPSGTTAVDPGYVFTGGQGRVTSSEPTAGLNGWKFTFAEGPANVTLSIRCLSNTTSDGDLLQSQELVRTVSVPPGQSVHSVICPVGYKGIVASYSLPDGVFLLGHEPQPISRVFHLQNNTGSNQSVKLDLLCLSNTTWHAAPPPPPPPPPFADPHFAGAAKIGSGRVSADVACEATAACAGSIKLRSHSKVVAGGRFAVAAGDVARVRLKLTRAGRRLVRKHRLHSLQATIALDGGAVVKQTVRVKK